MQASQILDIIQSFSSIKNQCAGIFSRNTIPSYLNVKSFLIANTQNDTEPGEHWFCIIRKSTQKYEYFDSLGIDEIKLKSLKTQNLFSKSKQSIIVFNETPFQKSNSQTCGLFVLYFIIHRMHNLDLSFSNLLNEIFVTDCDVNEREIEQFAKDNF